MTRLLYLLLFGLLACSPVTTSSETSSPVLVEAVVPARPKTWLTHVIPARSAGNAQHYTLTRDGLLKLAWGRSEASIQIEMSEFDGRTDALGSRLRSFRIHESADALVFWQFATDTGQRVREYSVYLPVAEISDDQQTLELRRVLDPVQMPATTELVVWHQHELMFLRHGCESSKQTQQTITAKSFAWDATQHKLVARTRQVAVGKGCQIGGRGIFVLGEGEKSLGEPSVTLAFNVGESLAARAVVDIPVAAVRSYSDAGSETQRYKTRVCLQPARESAVDAVWLTVNGNGERILPVSCNKDKSQALCSLEHEPKYSTLPAGVTTCLSFALPAHLDRSELLYTALALKGYVKDERLSVTP